MRKLAVLALLLFCLSAAGCAGCAEFLEDYSYQPLSEQYSSSSYY